MEKTTHVIAIDGPAGAGKSSVAKAVAKRLGFAYLDTGAMYRAATWRALQNKIDMEDAGALARSTEAMELRMSCQENGITVIVDGEDVTALIRTPNVTENIRKLDTIPAVRERMVAFQRVLSAKESTVAEGRDIGTVVFPGAACKIYLDASLEVRAARRAAELAEQGHPLDEAQIRETIRSRDESDKNRDVSPLRVADDAQVIDTSNLPLDEVVDAIVAKYRESV